MLQVINTCSFVTCASKHVIVVNRPTGNIQKNALGRHGSQKIMAGFHQIFFLGFEDSIILLMKIRHRNNRNEEFLAKVCTSLNKTWFRKRMLRIGV